MARIASVRSSREILNYFGHCPRCGYFAQAHTATTVFVCGYVEQVVFLTCGLPCGWTDIRNSLPSKVIKPTNELKEKR